MKFASSIACLIFILLVQSSCSDPCEEVNCLNGGICIEGDCDCPDNFIGNNCETFDFSKIQQLLDEGSTPKELFDLGVPRDSLLRKTYDGGYIFNFDTIQGSGLLAATEDLPTKASFGCPGFSIPGISPFIQPQGTGELYTQLIIENCAEADIAARLCSDLILNGKDDWFLPTFSETLDMVFILGLGDLDDDIVVGAPGNIGNFLPEKYLTCSQQESNRVVAFDFSLEGILNSYEATKTEKMNVRPVRSFDQ